MISFNNNTLRKPRIRLIFNASQLNVRDSVIMNESYVISTMTSGIDPRSHGSNETIFRCKVCWILLRNIRACNRAAETYLEPKLRIR